ncbi:unnamed protein product [Didymodactylos carnosus]|uniref:Uncharacterized protein n=1 Tax=Didymodactylos carnosus TaxID=1234261 RepID=A0A814B1U4_9BILA|nr:unnamed protein product [Didymodactylos carnosus]CAF1238571.1 unnamed protein product [Didymodactylos carnosus]CAF3701089.1 unnamed protein product [Didymodactylos carnosus]CAF4046134.1 unnamed protein product [Didymodactylos carnosus]
MKRLRRQNSLPYGGWSDAQSNPSGAIPGAYYGTGNNPNEGGYSSNDRYQGNINYSPYGSIPNLNSLPYNGNPNQNMQGGQTYYGSNIMFNSHNRPNKYPPGSQGWYATGGHYYNNRNFSFYSTGFFIALFDNHQFSDPYFGWTAERL